MSGKTLPMLDMRTIIFSHLLTDSVCTLVMIGLWWQNHRRFAGTGWWVLDFSCQTVAILLIALRGTIPDGLSMIGSNVLVIGGAIAGYRGLEHFVGRLSSQRGNLAYLLLFPLLHGYFLFVEPNLTARTLNTSFGLLLICGQCGWLMLRRAPAAMHPITRNVGLVFSAFALVNALRIVATLGTMPANNNFFRSGAVDTLSVLTYQVLIILLAYSLVLMVNRRLLVGIQSQEEKFSKAFHSSPYAITITRLSDGKIFEVNDGFVHLTGYQPQEVIGQTSHVLRLWEQESDRDRVFAALTRGEQIREAEFRFRAKSGEVGTGLFSADVVTIDNQPCILSSIADITTRKQIESEKNQLIDELHATLDKVKRLEGMLPICMYCKKIRDDGDQWQRLEDYIRSRSEADFSHGICPDCFEREHGELARRHGYDPAQLALNPRLATNGNGSK